MSKSRATAAGMPNVHLLHFTTGTPDKDIVVSDDTTLNNAPITSPGTAARDSS